MLAASNLHVVSIAAEAEALQNRATPTPSASTLRCAGRNEAAVEGKGFLRFAVSSRPSSRVLVFSPLPLTFSPYRLFASAAASSTTPISRDSARACWVAEVTSESAD